MDGGALTQNTDYPIKAFMTERAGKDYIRIMYQVGGGSFETSWTDKIRNLLPSKYCDFRSLFVEYESKRLHLFS